MKYFGIKPPQNRIWWIADSEHNSWMAFFTYPSNNREVNAHRLPLSEAIRAYEAIGYRCVELEVSEKANTRAQAVPCDEDRTNPDQ